MRGRLVPAPWDRFSHAPRAQGHSDRIIASRRLKTNARQSHDCIPCCVSFTAGARPRRRARHSPVFLGQLLRYRVSRSHGAIAPRSAVPCAALGQARCARCHLPPSRFVRSAPLQLPPSSPPQPSLLPPSGCSWTLETRQRPSSINRQAQLTCPSCQPVKLNRGFGPPLRPLRGHASLRGQVLLAGTGPVHSPVAFGRHPVSAAPELARFRSVATYHPYPARHGCLTGLRNIALVALRLRLATA